MNSKAVFGIVIFLLGIMYTVFRKQIVKILGPSKKGDYTEEVRENKILVGGIMFILVGIIVFFKFYEW
jgi:hypothetical protein